MSEMIFARVLRCPPRDDLLAAHIRATSVLHYLSSRADATGDAPWWGTMAERRELLHPARRR